MPTDASGTLTLRDFSEELKERLNDWKGQAQYEDDDVLTDFSFGLPSLLMSPKGGKGFFWIMHSSNLSLALSRNAKRMLWGQVRLSSEYLWFVRDLGKVLSDTYVFLTHFFNDQHIRLVPSSVDLAVDLANLDWGTVQDIKESFITRAQVDSDHVAEGEEGGFVDGPDVVYRRWRRLTGFSFGARAASVSATIYDKYHEVKYKKKEKEWFFDLWRQAQDSDGNPVWDGESPVWRVEMRLRREALNELMCEGVFHGVNDAFDLEGVLPGLWAYLVGHTSGGDDGLPDGWLRYVTPTDDTNRSRWPVHPDWQVVQSAFAPAVLSESGDAQEQYGESSFVPSDPLRFDLLPFVRRRKRKVNTDRMIAQIAGCLVTLEAWRPVSSDDGVSSDLSDTVHYAYRLIEGYLVKTKRDFGELVEHKRPLYSIDVAV